MAVDPVRKQCPKDLTAERVNSKLRLLFLLLVLAVGFPQSYAFMQIPTPVQFAYDGLNYAWYQANVKSDYVVVFLPGGQGSSEMLVGCAGNYWMPRTLNGLLPAGVLRPCWPIASMHSWLAAEFMSVGFDFIEPLTYTFTYGTRGWVIRLLEYVRYGLGYRHIVLAGFSAGAAVTADVIAWEGSIMNRLVDAAVIYEGPTILSGVLGSAGLAWNVTVPTLLIYGSKDEPISPEMLGVPVAHGSTYADNMNDAVAHQLIIVDKGHDITVIVDTLSELVSFLF